MSINRTDYVMIGIDIKDKVKGIDLWDHSPENKFLPYVEGHSDCEMRIVKDCMSGRYCFFGKVLKKANDYDGLDCKPIDLSDIVNYKYDVKATYRKLFGEESGYCAIKLYCFTNWS